MATREIWNGKGELPDGATYFTTNDGQIRGRPYVRERARMALVGYRFRFSLEARQETLRRTVDNDQWMAWRAGQLVAAVCRDVVEAAWDAHLDGLT